MFLCIVSKIIKEMLVSKFLNEFVLFSGRQEWLGYVSVELVIVIVILLVMLVYLLDASNAYSIISKNKITTAEKEFAWKMINEWP